MSDVTTLIYHPSTKMEDFSARIQTVCEDAHVTAIEAAVVDGALVLSLHVGVVEATDEDVEEEKESNGGKSDFKEGDFIPEGEALTARCMVLKTQTKKAAETTEAYLDEYIYKLADGMVHSHQIIHGRGLGLAPHPEDLDKPAAQQRQVYVEREVSYVVVVFLAEALDPDEENEQADIERSLRRSRPRSASEILNGQE